MIAVRSPQRILRSDKRKENKSKVCFDSEYCTPNDESPLASRSFVCLVICGEVETANCNCGGARMGHKYSL